MIVKSNPKAPEDYLKMFNSFWKHHKKMIIAWNEMDEYISNFDFSAFEDNPDLDNYIVRLAKIINKRVVIVNMSDYYHKIGLDEEFSTYQIFVNKAMEFDRNDRIEAIIKSDRCWLASVDVYAIRGFKEDYVQLDKEDDQPMSHFLEVYYNKIQSAEEPLRLIVKGYLDSVSSEHVPKDIRMDDLKHFIDLAKIDYEEFKPLADYSWANKSLTAIEFELTSLENQIRAEQKSGKKEYQNALAHASESYKLIEFDDGTYWSHIKDSECSFEAFLSKHCGTASDDEEMFSLRSVENGMIKTHLTISARPYDYKKVSIYEIKQVKASHNRPAPIEFWPHIMNLYQHKLIGWKGISGYRSEEDFAPSWIPALIKRGEGAINLPVPWENEKDENAWHKLLKGLHNKLLEKKPLFENIGASYVHYKILLNEITEYLGHDHYFKKQKVVVQKDGSIDVMFDSYFDMLDVLKQWDEKFGDADGIDEYYDSFSNYVDFDTYEDILKTEYQHVYSYLQALAVKEGGADSKPTSLFDERGRNLSGDSIVGKVTEALLTASHRGEESGWQSSRHDAYERHLDDLQLINSDGDSFASIHKLKSGKVTDSGYFINEWCVSFDYNMIIEYYMAQDELGYYDPAFASGRRSEGTQWDISWEGDMDYDHALENFPDAMFEQGFRGNKDDLDE